MSLIDRLVGAFIGGAFGATKLYLYGFKDGAIVGAVVVLCLVIATRK